MTHPASDLDDLVHQRTRLGILAILQEVGQLDFVALREQLAVTDGNLSQHLSTLEQAEYVQVHKGYKGRRPRTTVHITGKGRSAFAQELWLLRQIVSSVPEQTRTTGQSASHRASGKSKLAAPPPVARLA